MWSFSIKYDKDTVPFKTTLLVPNEETITLSNQHRAALGLAGILGEVNSAYHETLNGRELNQANRKNLLEMLKHERGIETRENYDLDKDLYRALLNPVRIRVISGTWSA